MDRQGRTRRTTATRARLIPAIVTVVLVAGAIGRGYAAARAALPHARATAAIPAAYPTPGEETYQGCPPQGDGGDTALNLLKNRIDLGRWHPVPLSSLLALAWPRAVEKARRSDWSPADAATVARDEGRPVVTEGYILLVRHEGPESPNCHDATARDYHTWLAASPGPLAARAHALIVELAPCVVALHPRWGTEADILALKGKRVRISGWLMLDQEHPEQVGKTRGTLWEIHPVMTIAVWQGGRWVDLDTGRVDTGASPGAGPTPIVPPARTTAVPRLIGALRVVVSVQPNPTSYGTAATVQASTAPGGQCGVKVVYASGTISTSRALQATRTADGRGTVAWTWRFGSHTTGQGRATVTCMLGGRDGVGSALFTVG